MYARLWWKDARQFWPIWVILVLAAAATQLVTLSYVGREARFGGLGISALAWASLYALAAGAAAFAGERETGTLRLLDIMPVDRHVVWAGKVSFALVTSAALTLLLLVMADWSTESWNPHDPLTAWQAIFFGMLVLVALGWGLFWSSILKSALTAAVAAICFAGLTLVGVLSIYLDLHSRDRSDATAFAGIAEIVVIGVTVAASDAFFTGATRLRRKSFEWLRGMPLEFRSPIVVTLRRSSRPRPTQLQTPVAVVPTPSPRPMAVARTPETSGAMPSSRWLWMAEARTLAGQTIKEGIKVWFLLAAIALGPPLLVIYFQSYIDSFWLLFLSIVVVLVAGVSAFGQENRARTQRFLVHHGARPGLVWLVKVSVWVTGVAVIGAALAYLSEMLTIAGLPRMHRIWTPFILTLSLAFGVTTLCGMVFRRGITALVLGLVLTAGVATPLLMLVSLKLLPDLGLAFVSIALLAISWAWRKDWIMDRPAPGRWLRLGMFLTGAFALLSAGYIGFRLWSVPDMGPIAKPAAWNSVSADLLSSDRNAAGVYREATGRLNGPVGTPEFLGRNKETLELIRRAAALPDCWFVRPDEQTLFDRTDMPPAAPLAQLVSLEAQSRMRKGDLAGSWDDIMVLFHMARHFSVGSGAGPAMRTLREVERDALGLAMEWAVARGQTPERLHAALAAYRGMPKVPSVTDILRAEATIVENTFDLPTSKFRDGLEAVLNQGHWIPETPWLQTAVPAWAVTPWERARGRRLNRMVSAYAIRAASLEPGRRPELAGSERPDWNDRYVWETTPALIQGLFWNWAPSVSADDHNEIARRALVQILAVRAWQLKHGGQFPERLEELVPEELASLPKDPYSDHAFGFVAEGAQRLLPLRAAYVEASNLDLQRVLVDRPPGSRLLYSVGPDRRDDHGQLFAQDRTAGPIDIIFAIPPVEGRAPTGKDSGDAAAKIRPGSASPK